MAYDTISEVQGTGTVVKSFGQEGREKGEFGGPKDVTVDDKKRI